MPSDPSIGAPPPRRWLAVELPAAYVASVLATIGLYQLAQFNSFFQQYLHTFVGAMFVAIPMIILLPRRESFDHHGLPPQPLWPELLVALGVGALLYPPFWIGFRLWWGWDRSFDLVLPEGFWNAALANLVIVALPEELFYRGYLQTRLELLVKPSIIQRRLRLPLIVLITAVAFALGHFVVTFDPQRLAVFFPALVFGWLRISRKSITAAVVFHAMCNIYMDFLLLGYGVTRPEEYFR